MEWLGKFFFFLWLMLKARAVVQPLLVVNRLGGGKREWPGGRFLLPHWQVVTAVTAHTAHTAVTAHTALTALTALTAYAAADKPPTRSTRRLEQPPKIPMASQPIITLLQSPSSESPQSASRLAARRTPLTPRSSTSSFKKTIRFCMTHHPYIPPQT